MSRRATIETEAAFRVLRRALVRRRLRQLEPVLRVELAAIAALVVAFVFWQARVPLDGLARRGGAGAVAGGMAAWLGTLALAGALAAGGRHVARLARTPAGPPWLALPVEPPVLVRHLGWEAAAPAALAIPPALAVLAAGWGLAPVWMLAVLALAFAAALALATRGAIALAFHAVVAASAPRAGLDGPTRLLATAARARPAARRRAARWRRMPAWVALWRKDLAVTRAPSAARARVLAPILFGASSVALWSLRVEPPALQQALAFALALVAAGTLAEWLIALAGSDPFSALRVLPLGPGALWGARAASAAVAIAALLAAHAAAAAPLTPYAREVFLTWTGLASAAIAALGVNYGVTLFPRADVASRLLALSLGLAIAASLMIPLVGWILLLAAVIHSARRLPRWSRLEEP